jgi:adenylate kinase
MMCGITGTPGTGKSSVASELGQRGYHVIHMTDIVQPYVTGKDPERDTLIVDVGRWAEEFEPVEGIVEGHLAHFLPCDRTIVLRCRPDILRERLIKRGYHIAKVNENVEAEALDVILIETLEERDPDTVLELDTTPLSPEECADRIGQFIRAEIPPSHGSIDWSAYLEATG